MRLSHFTSPFDHQTGGPSSFRRGYVLIFILFHIITYLYVKIFIHLIQSRNIKKHLRWRKITIPIPRHHHTSRALFDRYSGPSSARTHSVTAQRRAVAEGWMPCHTSLERKITRRPSSGAMSTWGDEPWGSAKHTVNMCCFVLYCIAIDIVLYCIVLYHIVLCHIILYYVILYCIMLYHSVWYCNILYDVVSYYTISYHIILFYTISYHNILYHVILYYNIFYCNYIYIVTIV